MKWDEEGCTGIKLDTQTTPLIEQIIFIAAWLPTWDLLIMKT